MDLDSGGSARVEGGFPPVGSDAPRLRCWSGQTRREDHAQPSREPDLPRRPRAGSREPAQGSPARARGLRGGGRES